jgi:hypothetical protein
MSHNRARTEANSASYALHFIDDSRNLASFGYGFNFTQVQEYIEEVWALGVLLQCRKCSMTSSSVTGPMHLVRTVLLSASIS